MATNNGKSPMTDASDDNGAREAEGVANRPQAPSGEMVPAEQVTAALEAAAEFKDKLLRTLADMENLRKRTEREIADSRAYGITAFARDVLQVADNMHRAREAIGQDLRDSADANVKALLEGIDLTERELLKVLEKNGVTKFSPLNEKFDPNFQQAMYEVADGLAAPGTVAQVIQAGYRIGERVLRPALVAVAKATPKQQANDNPPPDAG
jgi:molecular chaperone GrpE